MLKSFINPDLSGKKAFFVISLIVLSIILMAVTEKVVTLDEKIELIFENVKIKDIEFCDQKDVEVDFSKSDDVKVTKEKNVIRISSDDYAKISLRLPEKKDYIYQLEDAKCEFNAEKVVIYGDDGERVEFSDGNLFVKDSEGSSKVEIGSEGIFINNDDEIVEISSRGIIVETEDENKNLTGFWGQLLGGFVKIIAKTSISFVSKDPGKLMKQIINDKDDTYAGSFVHISSDDEDGELITKKFHDTFQPKKGCNLNVHNSNGKIEIKSWKEDHIDISAILKTRKSKNEFEKIKIEVLDKDGCTIKTKALEKNPKVNVQYEIKVPKGVKISDINSSNGKILVIDCEGKMNLNTSNGRIEVFDSKGSFIANSSNGGIEFVHLNGKAEAYTSNGAIRVVKTPGLQKAVTSNGKINLEIEEKIEDDIYLSTSNSSIKITIDPFLDLNIDASTSNSRIDLNGIEVTTSKFSKDSLVGKINKGGKKITASTSNGSISLYKLEK